MQEKLRSLLIEAAGNDRTFYYSDVAKILGISKTKYGFDSVLYRALEKIGVEEHAQGRPLLNILVVRVQDGLPGEKMYKWYKKHVNPEFNLKDEQVKITLVKKLTEDCFNYWKEALIAA